MESATKLGPYFHKRQGYNYFVYKFPDGSRRTVYEHREIKEQEVGRKLNPSEHVHHTNERKLDNENANLVVLTVSEHSKLHGKDRTEEALMLLRCAFCGCEFKRLGSDVRYAQSMGRTQFYCSYSCNGKKNGFRPLSSSD